MLTKILGLILSTVGALAATIGTQGCLMLILDEPESPASLIK